MSKEKIFVINLTDEESKSIIHYFDKSPDSFWKNKVYKLCLSCKLVLHFEHDYVKIKKQENGKYLVSFSELVEKKKISKPTKKFTVFETLEEFEIDKDNFVSIINQYDIWLVNNKLKSKSLNGLEKFVEKYIN